MKTIIFGITLCVLLSSCRERVKVVELQRIEVDTIYTYKVERSGGDEKYYDIEKTRKKVKPGEYILY